MAKIIKSQQQTTFYPLQGTAFYDKSKSHKLFIVESKENLAVINDIDDGFVAIHSLDEGYDDFSNWLSCVKEGKIEIAWCPEMKRVSSNNEYLQHWKLS